MIVLHGPEGERLVEENEPFQLLPGEQVIGSRGELTPPLETELQKEGIQWGDAVAWVTKKLDAAGVPGMKHCSACERRKQILNQAKKLGLKEVIRQIKNA